jgi:hypothetical protein
MKSNVRTEAVGDCKPFEVGRYVDLDQKVVTLNKCNGVGDGTITKASIRNAGIETGGFAVENDARLHTWESFVQEISVELRERGIIYWAVHGMQ